ncbi:MAG: 50S ribosomal protein L4 [Candidatus Thermoplasmatota archaeon]
MAKKMADKKEKTGAEVNIYTIGGEVRTVSPLPAAFQEAFRPDLIKRAVVAAQANRRQPYGPMHGAGAMHAVSTWGKGRGVARVQRLKQGSTAAESANNVGGRRAHPPRVERIWRKKINEKERLKALRSALHAAASPEIVRARGHRFGEEITLPVVVAGLEEIGKEGWGTKQALELLRSLGLHEDVLRAKNGKRIRVGRGKMRGRRYRTPRSILVVVRDKRDVAAGFRNLPGVDVVSMRELSTEHLAPGGMPGRLMMMSEDAFNDLGKERGK